MTQIGFIGLGMMGVPMADRLLDRGFTLTVQDADRARQEGFLARHPNARGAHGARDFAACSALITMLPNSDIIDEVVLGLLPHLVAGTTIIDMSSADPNRTRTLARKLREKQVDLIDAPVSGGVKKAVAGTLAIMAGGDPEVLQRTRPLLEAMGTNITHVGPVGAGHALKALNNYVSAAALIATAEAIHVGAAFGIEPPVIVDVINASTGRNNTTENKARQFMLNGAFNSGFSLTLQAKDVGIATALGRAMGKSMRLGEHVDAITHAAADELGPAADHTELYRYVD